MAAAAKPSAKGAVGAITRKIGPLPLWAWFVGALALYYVYTKLRGGSTASTTDSSGTPGAAATDNSGAPGADSGGGATDNMSSDLLQALLQTQADSTQSLLDALNSATQYTAQGYGGYSGAAPGSISASGTAAKSPTVVAQPQTANAPTNQNQDALTQTIYQTDTYQPSTGIYTTPEQVAIPPTTSYSDTPGGVTGPSIFAFKGSDNYSATAPATTERPLIGQTILA